MIVNFSTKDKYHIFITAMEELTWIQALLYNIGYMYSGVII